MLLFWIYLGDNLWISKNVHSKKGERIMPITIEEVRAMYFDTDALREPARKLRRLDGGDLRWYYTIENDEIIWFISVTSLIKSTMPTSPQLIKWMVEHGENAEAIRDEKANYGTAMHIAIGQYLLGKFNLEYNSVKEFLAENKVESFYTSQLQKDVLAFAQFCNDYDVKPLAIEVMLSDLKSGIAGACDLVCQMTVNRKRIVAMIDFKSGRKGFWEDNEIQLHAYKRLFESEFADIRIEKLFNWSPKDWTKEPTYNFKDQSESNSAKKLDYLIELFKISNKQKPSPRIQVNGILRFGEPVGNKFKFIDLENYIRENDEYFKQYITIETKQEYLSDDDAEVPFFDERTSVQKQTTNYLDF